MDTVNVMPIIGTVKPFVTFNECTVCTVETTDIHGKKRGAIAIGMSRDDLDRGVATYSSIEEAEALIALIQNGIDDAKRIEAGQPPIATEFDGKPVRKH